MSAGDAERGRRIGAGVLGVVAAAGIGHAVLTRGPEAAPAAIDLAGQVEPAGHEHKVGVTAPGAPGAPAERARAAVGSGAGSLIDINTASAAELDLLPGIGPALAGRIVEHRVANGSFSSVDGLDDVHGIGPRTIDRLRAMVTISD